MRMHATGTRRRLTVAFAATIGASLLTLAGGPSADAAAKQTYLKDPQILGEALPGSFVTATFNVLGASHTAGRGKAYSGPARMVHTVQLLRDNRVDVVGLQELETKQATAFKQLAPEYQLYSPPKDTRDSIAFRKDRFELVKKDGVSVPYMKNWRTMPLITLRDKATGLKMRVLSVHNVVGKEAKWVARRAKALRLELEKHRALQAKRRMPTLFMGDFNERTEAFYCQMLGEKFTSSSVWWTTPACELPARAGIDWIFGTPAMKFIGYQKQDGGLVDMASDHPLILTRITR